MTSDRETTHQYWPPSQEGELRFAWNGGEEYVRVYFPGAEYPHAVANTSDASDRWDTGWKCVIPAGDQQAFEAFCEEWMASADATELARPVDDAPLRPEEAGHLLEWAPADADPQALRGLLDKHRADRHRADRAAELEAARAYVRP
jgi:hypothetical protein